MNDYNKFNKVNKRKEEWQKWQLRASGDLGKTRMHYRHQRSHLITVWRYKHTIDWTFQNSGLFFLSLFSTTFTCAMKRMWHSEVNKVNKRKHKQTREACRQVTDDPSLSLPHHYWIWELVWREEGVARNMKSSQALSMFQWSSFLRPISTGPGWVKAARPPTGPDIVQPRR